MEPKSDEFQALQKIVGILRGPNGCPWDQQQTLRDVSRHLLEEASEVADAVASADGEPSSFLCEELGDVLMNILLASRIAEEQDAFTIDEVLRNIHDKLVRRHPHVFGETQVSGVDDVLRHWERIKAEEKKQEGPQGFRSRLADVPRSLPPLAQAYKVSSKAARGGFDWPDATGAMDKLREEVEEVRHLLDLPDTEKSSDSREESSEPPERQAELREEIGDVLFAAVSLCRKLGFHPDDALRATLKKFTKRFQYIERRLPNLETASLEQMDRLWDEMRNGTAERGNLAE